MRSVPNLSRINICESESVLECTLWVTVELCSWNKKGKPHLLVKLVKVLLGDINKSLVLTIFSSYLYKSAI